MKTQEQRIQELEKKVQELENLMSRQLKLNETVSLTVSNILSKLIKLKL